MHMPQYNSCEADISRLMSSGSVIVFHCCLFMNVIVRCANLTRRWRTNQRPCDCRSAAACWLRYTGVPWRIDFQGVCVVDSRRHSWLKRHGWFASLTSTVLTDNLLHSVGYPVTPLRLHPRSTAAKLISLSVGRPPAARHLMSLVRRWFDGRISR